MSAAIICEDTHRRHTRSQRVIVALQSETVTFEHCHQPRRLWAPAGMQETFSCPLADILEIHTEAGPLWILRLVSLTDFSPRTTTIVTRTGKAVIRTQAPGHDEVVDALAPYTERGAGPILDNPNAVAIIAIALATLLGAAIVAWLVIQG